MDTFPSDEDKKRYEEVARNLLKESDRGCVIFSAALVADALERLLRAFFRQDPKAKERVIDPMFQGYGPVASFKARLDLAYGMNLISASRYAQLQIVRRLRNDFAHEAGAIDFDDPRCNDRLHELIARTEPEADPKRMRVADQFLTREQLVRRLAFALIIAGHLGHLGLLAEKAEKGIDIRGVSEHIDLHRSKEEAEEENKAKQTGTARGITSAPTALEPQPVPEPQPDPQPQQDPEAAPSR